MTRAEAVALQHKLYPKQKWTITTADSDAHRPENYCEYQQTLPEICLELRQSITGAAAPWETEYLTAVRDMLAARARTWNHTGDVIDTCIWLIVQAVIKLASDELLRRARLST